MSRRRRRKRKEAVPPAPEAAGLFDRVVDGAERLARTRWAVPAALVALCLAVHARSLPLGLVNFDDDVYVFEDPRLERLSPSNLGRILTRPFFANYHPVTTLTYAFDRAVWGEWIPGFRLTHLAFYAGGVVLLYYLFRMLLGSVWAAFAAAAIYATHAVHVEAVAWLAQRKDVVCLVFYSASILAYVAYARGRERPRRFYWISVGLALLACLSKGYAVVLPGVLLAYDLCFAERIDRRQVGRMLLDKLPFVAVSAAVTVFTIMSQEEVGALLSSAYTGWERLVLLCKVFAVYAGKTLLPVRLSALYVVGKAWLPWWVAVFGALLGVGTVAGFFFLRRRAPAAAFGLALFALPLATVMNVFFTLRIWLADRYLFFPTIGSSLALVAAARWLFGRRPGSRARPRAVALGLAAAATVLLYSALTVARIPVWSGPVELWSDAVRKYAGVSGSGPVTADELARKRARKLSRQLIFVLAQAYGRAGNVEEAEALMAGVKKPSEGVEAGGELARARLAMEKGNYEEAIEFARRAGESETWMAARGWHLAGLAHAAKEDYDEARRAFLKALEHFEDSGRSGARVMRDLGLVELRTGNLEKAVEWYVGALKDEPGDTQAAFGLAVTYEQLGRPAEALPFYEEVLRRAPDHAQREVISAAVRRLRKALDRPEARGSPEGRPGASPGNERAIPPE